MQFVNACIEMPQILVVENWVIIVTESHLDAKLNTDDVFATMDNWNLQSDAFKIADKINLPIMTIGIFRLVGRTHNLAIMS